MQPSTVHNHNGGLPAPTACRMHLATGCGAGTDPAKFQFEQVQPECHKCTGMERSPQSFTSPKPPSHSLMSSWRQHPFKRIEASRANISLQTVRHRQVVHVELAVETGVLEHLAHSSYHQMQRGSARFVLAIASQSEVVGCRSGKFSESSSTKTAWITRLAAEVGIF